MDPTPLETMLYECVYRGKGVILERDGVVEWGGGGSPSEKDPLWDLVYLK